MSTHEILKAKYAPEEPKALEVVAETPTLNRSYEELLALYEKILEVSGKSSTKLEGSALIEHILQLNRESQTKRKLSNA